MLFTLTEEYFNAFSNKDIFKLGEIFDKNIYLKDWELEAFGLNDVMQVIKNLFEKNEFRIEIQNMYSDKNTVIAEIHLFYELNKYIKVVDIIEFNQKSLIEGIRAYKG